MSITAMSGPAPVSPCYHAQPGRAIDRCLAFGPFLLKPGRQLLLKQGVPVRIGGRAFDILTALAEQPGEIVSKRELLRCAWPDIFVGDGNLKVNIASLRRALDDAADAPRYIATVTGRGYRFIADVRSWPVAERISDRKIRAATRR